MVQKPVTFSTKESIRKELAWVEDHLCESHPETDDIQYMARLAMRKARTHDDDFCREITARITDSIFPKILKHKTAFPLFPPLAKGLLEAEGVEDFPEDAKEKLTGFIIDAIMQAPQHKMFYGKCHQAFSGLSKHIPAPKLVNAACDFFEKTPFPKKNSSEWDDRVEILGILADAMKKLAPEAPERKRVYKAFADTAPMVLDKHLSYFRHDFVSHALKAGAATAMVDGISTSIKKQSQKAAARIAVVSFAISALINGGLLYYFNETASNKSTTAPEPQQDARTITLPAPSQRH